MSKPTLVDRLFNSYVAGRALPAVSGGDGNATPSPTPTPTPTATETSSAPDLGKLVSDAIARAGDPNAALKSLVADNYALRDDLKAARGKLPADGAVVLSADEAKDWAAFRQLGKPGDVRKALDEGNGYKTKALGYEREKHHGEVATVAGYKPAVLDRLAGQDNLTLVIKEEKGKDGKPARVAYVQLGQVAEGKEPETKPLTEYAEAHWKDFLPALKGVEATQQKPPLNGTPTANHYRPAPRPAIEGGTHRRRTNVF